MIVGKDRKSSFTTKLYTSQDYIFIGTCRNIERSAIGLTYLVGTVAKEVRSKQTHIYWKLHCKYLRTI